MRMILEIEGMHCDACVRRVTKALAQSGAGAIHAVRLGEADIEALSEAAPSVIAALVKAGFPAHVQS